MVRPQRIFQARVGSFANGKTILHPGCPVNAPTSNKPDMPWNRLRPARQSRSKCRRVDKAGYPEKAGTGRTTRYIPGILPTGKDAREHQEEIKRKSGFLFLHLDRHAAGLPVGGGRDEGVVFPAVCRGVIRGGLVGKAECSRTVTDTGVCASLRDPQEAEPAAPRPVATASSVEQPWVPRAAHHCR
jgi:hypothetical protein